MTTVTQPLHEEHQELLPKIERLRAELLRAPATGVQIQALRRVLYGLYTLVKVHLAKEEEVYLPLLDARLSPAEARQMFAALEAAAHDARHRLAQS